MRCFEVNFTDLFLSGSIAVTYVITPPPLLLHCFVQERTAIQGLHDAVFSSSTGELAALDLAPDFGHTLWAACMVNSRSFSDNVSFMRLLIMLSCAHVFYLCQHRHCTNIDGTLQQVGSQPLSHCPAMPGTAHVSCQPLRTPSSSTVSPCHDR
jgi:hypothetical protein